MRTYLIGTSAAVTAVIGHEFLHWPFLGVVAACAIVGLLATLACEGWSALQRHHRHLAATLPPDRWPWERPS